MQTKFIVIVFILIPSVFLGKTSYSQSETDNLNKYIDLLNPESNHKHNKHSHSGLIGFYKTYISSQDDNNCPYSPSCSLYTFHAIEKHGIIFGLIKGFDRLSRCNRHQNEHYDHSEQHKLIDHP